MCIYIYIYMCVYIRTVCDMCMSVLQLVELDFLNVTWNSANSGGDPL